MKLFIILFFIFLVPNSFGSLALEYGSYACGRNSTSSSTLDVCTNGLRQDIQGGADRAHPDIIYIPFKQNATDVNFTIFDNLFIFEEYIQITLRLKNTGTIDSSKYYYAAVRDSDNTYKVANRNIAKVVQQDQYLTFTISNLRLSEISDSSSILDFTKTSGSVIIYIFTSTSTFNSSEIDVTSTEYTGGHYVKLNFSSVYDSSNTPELTSVKRGDKQLKINYNRGNVSSSIYSGDNSNFLYSIIYYFDNASSVPGNFLNFKTIKSAGGVYQTQENENYGGGTLKNLANGTTYFTAVSLVNKYYFTSLSTEFLQGTPQKLEAFLEGKSCYLISAGFQTDHYVLEYFRMIRDNYLLKFKAGQVFVLWYYTWAPQVAMTIIEHPILAAGIRGVAYTFYFIFNYLPVFLSLIFSSIVMFYFLLKHKEAK